MAKPKRSRITFDAQFEVALVCILPILACCLAASHRTFEFLSNLHSLSKCRWLWGSCSSGTYNKNILINCIFRFVNLFAASNPCPHDSLTVQLGKPWNGIPKAERKEDAQKTPSGNMFELRLRIGAGHTWTTLKSSGKEEVEKGDP